MQAIANRAGFHFAYIEQGGASLYTSMSIKVTDLEVLRIVVSIGGVEVNHFGLWHDKAGNAVSQPLAGVTCIRREFTGFCSKVPEKRGIRSKLCAAVGRFPMMRPQSPSGFSL